jgi:hypothetical protein
MISFLAAAAPILPGATAWGFFGGLNAQKAKQKGF